MALILTVLRWEPGNDRFVFGDRCTHAWKNKNLENRVVGQHFVIVPVHGMYKKNQGHGICGAKNVYSSNVKLGNWVEDTIGLDLVQKGRHVESNYMSHTSLSYKAPNDQPPLPAMPINMPTTEELKAKNKEGMPYSLIFDHGLKEIPPEVRHIYPFTSYPTPL